jgi:hypothetical protein
LGFDYRLLRISNLLAGKRLDALSLGAELTALLYRKSMHTRLQRLVIIVQSCSGVLGGAHDHSTGVIRIVLRRASHLIQLQLESDGSSVQERSHARVAFGSHLRHEGI